MLWDCLFDAGVVVEEYQPMSPNETRRISVKVDSPRLLLYGPPLEPSQGKTYLFSALSEEGQVGIK